MAVNDLDGIRVCNGNVVRLNTNNFAQLLVDLIHGQIPATTSALVHEP